MCDGSLCERKGHELQTCGSLFCGRKLCGIISNAVNYATVACVVGRLLGRRWKRRRGKSVELGRQEERGGGQ